MLRYLIILGLIYLFYYAVKKTFFPSPRGPSFSRGQPSHDRPGAEKELVQDPQCQTYIPKDTALTAHLNGHTYYFCSRECLEQFTRNR